MMAAPAAAAVDAAARGALSCATLKCLAAP